MKRHSQLSGILISSSMLLLASQAAWSAAPESSGSEGVPAATVSESVQTLQKESAVMTSAPTPEATVASKIAQSLSEAAPTAAESTKVPASTASSTLNPKDTPLKLSALPESKSASVAPTQRIAQATSPEVLFPNPQVSVTRDPSASGLPSIPNLNGGSGLPSNSSVQILNTGGGPRPALPTLGQSNSIPNGGFSPNGIPSTLPRAVPPPVGDISVSNFGPNFGAIDLGTTQRLPRLILREAPVREVLSLLARSVGMNVVFTNESQDKDSQQATPTTPSSPEGPKISLDIENESVQDVFNYVLRVGGLQANRSGRTIFVGTKLPVEAQNIIVRTLRLNQVESTLASTYLSTLGAETRQFIQTKKLITLGEGAAARVAEEFGPPQVVTVPVTEGKGPLPLLGLSVSVDPRLNTITLLGDPQKVSIATNLLTQLDARKRQVLVNVKIVDVNLNNAKTQNSSFSFRVGQNTFSVDNGAALYNFGPSRPPTSAEARGSLVFPVITPITPAATAGFFDNNPNALQSQVGTTATIPGLGQVFLRAPFGTQTNPFQPGVSQAQNGQITIQQPSLYQFPSQFLSQLQSQIVSRNAKILTDPSLVVQEGERAKVALTSQVIGNITSTTTSSGTNLTTQTITANIVNAGLELNVNVERIDDNGFVTLTVNPQVTTPSPPVNLSVGGSTNQIQLLNTRSVESGRIRLRDGQTLILSGVIQDSDRATVTKVPILGDLPILGTLFRSTGKTNDRSEVIVLITPQILDDSDRATFGYGYTPSNEVQKALSGR